MKTTVAQESGVQQAEAFLLVRLGIVFGFIQR